MNQSCHICHLGEGEALANAKAKNEAAIKGLKGDIENLEMSLDKAETEKKTKDNQISTLNEEMARQDEAVSIIHVIFWFDDCKANSP